MIWVRNKECYLGTANSIAKDIRVVANFCLDLKDRIGLRWNWIESRSNLAPCASAPCNILLMDSIRPAFEK